MMVQTAVFTCSICSEASVNICAYCTKDACSNHRCERCKRCSDCCECEVPLSAEEAVVAAEVAAPEVVAPEVVAPEVVASEVVAPEVIAPEVLAAEVTAAEMESAPPEALPREPGRIAAPFLTLEESSVFSEPFVPEEPESHEPGE